MPTINDPADQLVGHPVNLTHTTYLGAITDCPACRAAHFAAVAAVAKPKAKEAK